MLFRILPSRLLLAAAVLALPLTGGGCGRQACFTWTASEGTCPAQSEALAFFSSPRCPGRITSVESAPTSELDGTLCCYEVAGDERVDQPSCQGFGGSNSGSESSGFGGSAEFAVSSTGGPGGFGGQGGSAPCARCAEAFTQLSPEQLCSGTSADLLKTLFGCACNTTCAAQCGDSFCAGNPPSPECGNCLQDPVQGCGEQLAACANDL
ncbi:MAG: hypothetical protein ACMG6S_14840 [Byssovorax sp.]